MQRIGYTGGVSPSDPLVKTPRPPPVATRLHVEPFVEPQSCYADALVVRLVKRSKLPAGAGVRLLGRVDVIRSLSESHARPSRVLHLAVTSA